MAFATLKDVYIDQIKDLYSANMQAIPITGQFADIARHPELRKALKAGVAGIGEGRDVLAEIARAHGEDPGGTRCQAMDGLVKEAELHAIDATYEDDDVRDAVIISQYQRMVHYAIAGYGCLRAWAKRLGLDDDATKLERLLDDTRGGDRHMTEIAEGQVNKDAA